MKLVRYGAPRRERLARLKAERQQIELSDFALAMTPIEHRMGVEESEVVTARLSARSRPFSDQRDLRPV
jgi:hypothetical protein